MRRPPARSFPVPAHRTRLVVAVAATSAGLLAAGGGPVHANTNLSPTATRSGVVVPGNPASCPVSPSLAKHEMRGVWIATVANIDWPSRTGLSPSVAQAELVARLDQARRQGLNTVVLQVRPSADTLWPSTLEPWSRYLTGTQGRDPGWDPLGFAVREAHARGLELHAWVNPYRVANDTGASLSPTHPARLHPEWTVTYNGRLYYNPGLPEVRAHVVKVVSEVVSRYDVDAIHFDDYFYPYPVAGKTFDDRAAYATYGAGRSLADWRRANTTALVTEVRDAVRRIRPGTQFGVSPFGVWRNASTDASGSRTSAGVESYDDVFADTHAWARQGLVDYIAPQDYWSRTLAVAPYDAVASWWADVATTSPRTNVYLGEATYKVGVADEYGSDTAWTRTAELPSHMAAVDAINAARPSMLAGGGAVKGHIFFSAADMAADRLGSTSTITRTRYRKPALTPTTPWLDAARPPAPRVVRRGTTLTVIASPGVTQVVVYRVPASARNVTPCQLADMRHVVAVTSSRTVTDAALGTGFGRYTWLVSAVDRASNESDARVVR